jgi:uncharacterized membrane protein
LFRQRALVRGLAVLGVAGLCVLCAVAGASMSRHFGTSSYTISYADFISVMLSAISVLLTALTIFLAVLGVLGWAAIAKGVRSRTEEFLNEGFREGEALYLLVESQIATQVYRGVGAIPDETEDGGEPGEEATK